MRSPAQTLACSTYLNWAYSPCLSAAAIHSTSFEKDKEGGVLREYLPLHPQPSSLGSLSQGSVPGVRQLWNSREGLMHRWRDGNPGKRKTVAECHLASQGRGGTMHQSDAVAAEPLPWDLSSEALAIWDGPDWGPALTELLIGSDTNSKQITARDWDAWGRRGLSSGGLKTQRRVQITGQTIFKRTPFTTRKEGGSSQDCGFGAWEWGHLHLRVSVWGVHSSLAQGRPSLSPEPIRPCCHMQLYIIGIASSYHNSHCIFYTNRPPFIHSIVNEHLDHF